MVGQAVISSRGSQTGGIRLRTLKVLVTLLLASACATSTTQPASAPTTRSNGQLIQSLYDSFGRGDVPTVLAAFDPEIVWMEAENTRYADRNPYRGPQAVLEGVFMRLGGDWNDFRLHVDEIVDGGDAVVALGRYSGTNKATGQALNSQFAHVWHLRNGKVVRFQQYADTVQFARASGDLK